MKGEAKIAGVHTKYTLEYTHCLRLPNTTRGARLYVPLSCKDGRKFFNRGLILNLGQRRVALDTLRLVSLGGIHAIVFSSTVKTTKFFLVLEVVVGSIPTADYRPLCIGGDPNTHTSLEPP